MKRASALPLLLFVCAMGACEDSIHAGWLVDRPRVLGARVSAIADTRRASLAPGERGRIEWLVAVPDGPPKLAWTFVACVAPEGRFARPRCETPVVATGSGASTSELVTTELTAPTTEALAGSTELVVLAAFCVEGTPTLDARELTATCGAGDPLLASAYVRLATTEPNTNPPPPAVRLGDAPLVEDDRGTAGAPCTSSPSAPKVAPAAEIDFVHIFDGAARERQEWLTLSTVVTGGELDRQYSAFDSDEEATKEARVAWTAPKGGVPPAGRVVRLYALLRDDRGGASFSRFSVCVSPN